MVSVAISVTTVSEVETISRKLMSAFERLIFEDTSCTKKCLVRLVAS